MTHKPNYVDDVIVLADQNEAMDTIVAERKLILELKTGERCPITIKIGQPYHHWACPLSIDGLYNRLSDAAGVDSFQALMLAQNLVKTLLKNALKDGGKLYRVFEDEEDDATEVDVEIMFSKGL